MRKKIGGVVRTRDLVLRLSLPVMLLLLPSGTGTATASPTLIGANYSHYGLVGRSFDSYGILANGTFARKTVKEQLAAMRAAGINWVNSSPRFAGRLPRSRRPTGAVFRAGARRSALYTSLHVVVFAKTMVRGAEVLVWVRL